MPNFKLSTAVRENILHQVKGLAQRRVDYAQADFPLTVATIQYRVMREDQLKLLHELEALGYELAPTHAHLTISLPAGETYPTGESYPGLLRSVAVGLSLPEEIHLPRNVYMSFFDTKLSHKNVHDLGKMHHLAMDPVADAAEIAALVAWSNAAVRERRQQELINWTAAKVLDRCDTTAKLLATWPLLATLVTDAEWRNRFRSPPRHLRRWAPTIDTMARYGRHMQAAEILLVGAQVTEDYKPVAGVIQAGVQAWQRLPND